MKNFMDSQQLLEVPYGAPRFHPWIRMSSFKTSVIRDTMQTQRSNENLKLCTLSWGKIITADVRVSKNKE